MCLANATTCDLLSFFFSCRHFLGVEVSSNNLSRYYYSFQLPTSAYCSLNTPNITLIYVQNGSCTIGLMCKNVTRSLVCKNGCMNSILLLRFLCSNSNNFRDKHIVRFIQIIPVNVRVSLRVVIVRYSFEQPVGLLELPKLSPYWFILSFATVVPDATCLTYENKVTVFLYRCFAWRVYCFRY